jgi:glycosyl transferase family 1
LKTRLKTLLLESNGVGWREHAADTTFFGLLGANDYGWVPQRLRGLPIARGLKRRYDALSYTSDWRDALAASPALDVTVCNVTNLVDYARQLGRIDRFELVIILHTVVGDSMGMPLRTVRWFRKRRGKLVVFIGNEYDLMGEKFEFLRATEADYVCSQLPIETARWLYADCVGTEVLPMPHALNPDLYHPSPMSGRPLDIGFIGALYSPFIGDVERTRLIKAVEQGAESWELRCDIRPHNVPRAQWASFLNRSKGTVGGESGSYYLDRKGAIIAAAKEFLATHPGSSFKEVYEQVFADPQFEHVSGKCLASRHFEAIGTKTCQVLLEGDYNGILRSGEHYIGVRRDLSNLDAAIQAFKEPEIRREITDRAYAYVLKEHTYAHRVKALLAAIGDD